MDADAARADVALMMTSADRVLACGSTWRPVEAHDGERRRVMMREEYWQRVEARASNAENYSGT